MRLLPIPDETGKPTLYINPDHLVSVQATYFGGANGIKVAVELKVDGMPLQRVHLGEHFDRIAAEAAFQRFMAMLTGSGGQS